LYNFSFIHLLIYNALRSRYLLRAKGNRAEILIPSSILVSAN